jgi:hypothetical protein
MPDTHSTLLMRCLMGIPHTMLCPSQLAYNGGRRDGQKANRVLPFHLSPEVHSLPWLLPERHGCPLPLCPVLPTELPLSLRSALDLTLRNTAAHYRGRRYHVRYSAECPVRSATQSQTRSWFSRSDHSCIPMAASRRVWMPIAPAPSLATWAYAGLKGDVGP